MGLLDFFFPKYCVNCKKLGSYLCDKCFIFLSFDTASICAICDKPSITGLTHPGCSGRYTIDGVFAAVRYEKTAKKLVQAFKYKPYVTDLCGFLVDMFYESLIQNEVLHRVTQNKKDEIVISFIPVHESKLKKRGYNQAYLLAEGLSKKFHMLLVESLSKTKETQVQATLKKEDRISNIKGVFAVQNSVSFQDKIILLVDDVVTTGTTLSEAGNVLKRNGAQKVYGLTFARG